MGKRGRRIQVVAGGGTFHKEEAWFGAVSRVAPGTEGIEK